MINGYIPEKIVYVCKKSESITPKFSDTDEEFFSTSAMPAFPVDPVKENTLETARNWAAGRGYNSNDEVHKEVEMLNEPIYEVQIVDLEIRGEGGRAYKAIVHGSFLVDIREDVILEAMLEKGIRQGSFISCNFIWCRVGTQMKLVRSGSSLHKAIQAAHILKQQKKVSTKDLVPGTIYQNIQGEYLFLGFIKTADLKLDYIRKRTNMFNRNNGGHYVVEGRSKVEKRQLWLDVRYIHHNDSKVEELDIDDVMARIKETGYSIDMTKSKTIYPCTHIEPLELPDNIIDKVKDSVLKYYGVDRSKHTSKLLQYMSYAIMSKYPDAPAFNDVTQKIWDEAVTE